MNQQHSSNIKVFFHDNVHWGWCLFPPKHVTIDGSQKRERESELENKAITNKTKQTNISGRKVAHLSFITCIMTAETCCIIWQLNDVLKLILLQMKGWTTMRKTLIRLQKHKLRPRCQAFSSLQAVRNWRKRGTELWKSGACGRLWKRLPTNLCLYGVSR